MIIIKDDPTAHLYSITFPEGSTLIGTICRDNGDKGALIRLKNGYYVQINHGVLKALEQDTVKKRLWIKNTPV